MEFLGISIRVHRKKKNSKYVVDSHISQKALKDKGEKLANQVKKFCSYQGSDKEAWETSMVFQGDDSKPKLEVTRGECQRKSN